MTPREAREHKPQRGYDGPVEFLEEAARFAEDWDDYTLIQVSGRFPYPPGSGVRLQDWVKLVAHTSRTRPEDPIACADRLALYVTARAEQTNHHPTPSKIEETQT